MKKITLFILMLCYLLVTTGVVTVSHYCMDRLASVSFYTAAEKKCSKCGMKKGAHSCCNDKEVLLKVNTDQNKTPVIVYNLPPVEKLPVLTTEFLLTTLQNSPYRLQNELYPPPLPGNDIYLENNVFRI